MEQQKKKDFFISYTNADREWAEWIAWQLEAVGYTTNIQAWDFGPGDNFVIAMQEAVTKSARTIAVLSPDYLQSKFVAPEWLAAFAQDPTGEKRLFIPVRVREVDLTGILGHIVYIDLVNCSEEEARNRLTRHVGASIDGSRAKPSRSSSIFPRQSSTENHTISDHSEIKASEKQTKTNQEAEQNSEISSLKVKQSPRKKASTHKKKSDFQPVPPDPAEIKKYKYEQIHGNKDDAIANQDYLGRQNLVIALTEILTAKENFHHQTIGLLGDWGSGKSTFVNLLKSSLKKQSPDQFLYAEFNAWEYEHTDHMQAGIAREAMKGLISDLNWYEKIILAFRLAKAEKPSSVWLSVCSTVVLFASIAIGFSQFQKPAETIFVLASILGSSAALVLWKFLYSIQKMLKSPLVSEWKNYLSLPDYDRYLGTIPVMKQQIFSLCQLRLGIGKSVAEQKRLLYVVDDLDRCSHVGVVKTLEAIRLVMGIPQVIVIIAIDQRIALASLALHYKDLAGYHEQGNPGMIARDYLGKVIQLPIYLHAADNDTITSFVDRVLLNESIINTETHKVEIGPSESGNNPISPQPSNESIHSSVSQSHVRNAPDKSIKNEVAVEKIEYQFSPPEKEAFRERIKKFHFSNPRQIKRLYNSFNLLRHLLGSEQANDHMLVLFWLEYLNSCNPGERKNINEKRHEFLSEQFKNEDYYKQIERQVKPFVLPAWDQVT